MGNRMFQYAFGYLLAKKKNTDLYTSGLPNFNIQPHIPPAWVSLRGVICTGTYGNQYVDMQALLETDKSIVVNSYVQKACYHIQDRDTLRDVFNIKHVPINAGKLVLHIRETDYVKIGKSLNYKHYKQLINESKFTDIVIVTDNSQCDTVKRLISEGCTLNTSGVVDEFDTTNDERGMNDFNTLLQSENIAISQSTFSWWAAFLGNHKRIIIPYTREGGMWSLHPGKDDIDLNFHDEGCVTHILDN